MCATCSAQTTDRVDATHYENFWLWAGVKPQPVLASAKQLYILAGEVRGAAAQWVMLRPSVPSISHSDVWMVVRVETLDWTPELHKRIQNEMTRWHRAGNRLVGLQIDFDARTRHLDRYAEFLREVRMLLPRNYKLGITGLLDWSAQGDPTQLRALRQSIDEVVIQMYQGRHTIPGYRRYLGSLKQLQMPFRIGLVQGGEWTAPTDLTSNPNFRGYVVFLVNDAVAD